LRRILNSYVEIRLVPICTRMHDQIVTNNKQQTKPNTIHDTIPYYTMKIPAGQVPLSLSLEEHSTPSLLTKL